MTVLSGWKEIAQYLRRGVRTVQRWESLGLPVIRPAARSRSAVCARTDEVDSWLRGSSQELDRLRQRVQQLEIENAALKAGLSAQQATGIQNQNVRADQPAGSLSGSMDS